MYEQQKVGEMYFASLNRASKRIVEDAAEVRKRAGDTWDELTDHQRDKMLDERLIDSLNGTTPRAQKYYTLDRRRVSNGNSAVANGNSAAANTTVRLSTFGVEQVYPRFKVASGQKEVTVDETSGSSSHCDLSSDCSFSYRDEHSAPFSWMTRSQQELRFEAGTPDITPTADEVARNGLETLGAPSPASSTSARSPPPGSGPGSNRQSLLQLHLIRQSRGNPSYAKAVQIPQVPGASGAGGPLTRSPSGEQNLVPLVPRMDPPVSPHRINNFVCETSQNRLIFDFGQDYPGVAASPEPTNNGGGHPFKENPRSGSECSSSCSGHASNPQGGSILARMRQKTRSSIKRSLSTVSNRRRRRSSSGQDPNQQVPRDSRPGSIGNGEHPTNLSSAAATSTSTRSLLTISNTSMTSLNSGGTLTATAKIVTSSRKSSSSVPPPHNGVPVASRPPIVKPTHAPPLPPTHIAKPSTAPPPPPPPPQTTTTAGAAVAQLQSAEPSTKQTKDPSETNGLPSPTLPSTTSTLSKAGANDDVDDALAPLDNFKIDLNTDLEIPKTGFDFLDNW